MHRFLHSSRFCYIFFSQHFLSSEIFGAKWTDMIIFYLFPPLYKLITSIAHHVWKTRCELLARDSDYNFLFSFIKRGFAGFQKERQFQTRSQSNLWFLSNMILFLLFGYYLVTTKILLTMTPSIQQNVYYPSVALIFH